MASNRIHTLGWWATAAVMIGIAALPSGTPASARTESDEVELSAIDRVWAGHSVQFALSVTSTMIVVGYYDANRQLTVASRSRNSAYWVYQKLDSWVGWDSHNYVALAVDKAGQIHVSANMHGDPLVYFHTLVPGDVRTLVRQKNMVDSALERSVTYPVFLQTPDGRLMFKYRDGSSGNGNEIYDVHDTRAGRWVRLTATPLTDGEGRRNAYFVGPVLGPDGMFHLAWVWRETPMAETNHDLSYAKSRDLVHWERSDGSPLSLPIRLSTAEVVDDVPVKGGMINNNTVIGFDPDGAAMIAYHKFDAAGNTQIYVARRERTGWRRVQVSDWRGFRWDFRGGGSLESRLSITGPTPVGRDRIRVSVVRDGQPIEFLLDARTLTRVSESRGNLLAERLAEKVTIPSGMRMNVVEDPGNSGLALAWATRPPNRDLPGIDIPDPTILRLVAAKGR